MSRSVLSPKPLTQKVKYPQSAMRLFVCARFLVGSVCVGCLCLCAGARRAAGSGPDYKRKSIDDRHRAMTKTQQRGDAYLLHLCVVLRMDD